MKSFCGFAAGIALCMLLHDVTIDADYGTAIFHLILFTINGLFAAFYEE